jgi:hypothetical protein
MILALQFADAFHLRDAWAKHKDLDSYEAKWLYVDALLKVSLPGTDVLLLNLILPRSYEGIRTRQ